MQSTSDNPGSDVITVDSPASDCLSQRQRVGAAGHQARLGHFVVLYQLGAGGMGAVFAAFDTRLDRKVALKILHSHRTTRDHQHQRTLREAKALARVNHPRVVSVYDVGEAEGQVYLAMEFVDGMTLRKWQSQEPRSWREVLQIYLQAGAGLEAVHQAGIIHREAYNKNTFCSLVGH